MQQMSFFGSKGAKKGVFDRGRAQLPNSQGLSAPVQK